MKRLQTKITLIYVLLTLLVVIGVGILSMIEVESYFTRHLVRLTSNRGAEIILLLGRDSTMSDETRDQRLKDLDRTTGIRITLLDERGDVLTDSRIARKDLPKIENHLQRPEVREALVEGVGSDIRHSATVGKDFLYVATLLQRSAATGAMRDVCFFRLSVPLEEVESSIAEIRFNIVLAGLGVLVIVLGVSTIVSRRISNPMVAIAEGVREIRTGNLEQHIEVTSDDEIGQVARAVNELVDRLKADIVQLKKLERVRSEFLGNVSHELRTPLFSMQGFLETLLDGAIEDPRVNREFIQKAYNHSARLNALLGDLITISQIESGEMKMSFRYFKLRDFLESLVREYQPTADHQHVRLSLKPVEPDIEVMGDKERLHTVMDNLIQNAIKYNIPDGSVVLACEREDGNMRVSVSDTGVGIPKEHLPRIFERFYRVDKNRSRDVGGTGLGLAIVKHIVEAHESTVRAESEVGRGSTFSFTLRT